jgi:hypothetical protein
VYLFVTQDLLADVGVRSDEGFDGFLAAVRAGPPGVTRAGHCQRVLEVARRWRKRGFTYPPYLAYLALFVLAGGHEGDFDPRAYYPRLWELLDEPGSGTPPSFDRMLELWDDLERWSVHDRHGELGLFEARIVGGKIHIGLPLAQTMFTEAELHALPGIFADAGLEPGSLPSDREYRRALIVQGRRHLRRPTIAALERGSESIVDAMLEVVADEFADWDGEVTDQAAPPGTSPEVSAGLRICLSVDRVSGRASVVLRCRSKRELPEDGLVLSSPDTTETLTCTAYVPGWSGALVQTRDLTGIPFAPNHAAWLDGLNLAGRGPLLSEQRGT